MAVKGIDVSKWQGDVDFAKVRAAGYEFVIINAGYGRYISQKDKYFEDNYKKARAAGLGVGAYWYSYAVNASEAKQEAKVFLQAVKGKVFDYPLCYDIEDSSQAKLSNTVIGDMINGFCGHLESKGYYAALYSYANFLNTKVPAECKKKYDVWVAAYDVSKPSYNGDYGMWQYTSSGKVNGVNGNCDCDYAYKDYPVIMSEKGLNGYSKGGAKPLDTEGFKSGDKSLGVYAMKRLLWLAYGKGLVPKKPDDNNVFGEGTEADVNSLLKSWGYAENGVAGEEFIRRLAEALNG